MSGSNFEADALFAIPRIAPGSSPEKGLLSWSRPFLMDEVKKRGVDVYVARGTDSINEDEGRVSDVIRPEYSPDLRDVTIRKIGDCGLVAFDMMRSIVGRKRVDHLLPVLNPTALREITSEKYRTAEELLQPLGLFDRTIVLIRHGEAGVGMALDTVPGRTVVAKPNKGMQSKGVVVSGREGAYDALRAIEKDYVVEERLDFAPAWPSIRGEDELQQARLDSANEAGVNKELRLYSFGNQQWHAVGRVARPGETDFRDDKWLYVDQDSIPQELFEAGEAIIRRVGELTGYEDVNLGVDFAYTRTESDSDPKWRVMEVNSGEPQLVQLDEHEKIGRRHHELLADQIARIAMSKKGRN